ncbi:MAG: hypothetical protein JNL98_26775 [Bryobacterales bacterium]|nr:hypothetical protein [Bryobacterales bacterium]
MTDREGHTVWEAMEEVERLPESGQAASTACYRDVNIIPIAPSSKSASTKCRGGHFLRQAATAPGFTSASGRPAYRHGWIGWANPSAW